MNRYALFFVLLNLSLATQLHATEDAQSEELKSKIQKIFKEEIKPSKNDKLKDEFERDLIFLLLKNI